MDLCFSETYQTDCMPCCYIAIGIAATLLLVALVQCVFLIVCGIYLRKKNRIIKSLNGPSTKEGNGGDDMEPTKQISNTAYIGHKVTTSEATSTTLEQQAVQYNRQKETVTIQQGIDAMYDVVCENASRANPPPPNETDGSQAEYDVLHASVDKAQTLKGQVQQGQPTSEYAVINKATILSTKKKEEPREMETSFKQSKPTKKERKGKKKKALEAELSAPPPIPPQLYLQEDPLPTQDLMQQTNDPNSGDLRSVNVNYPDSMYDVITH